MKNHVLDLFWSADARRAHSHVLTLLAAVVGMVVVASCETPTVSPNTASLAGYYGLATVNDSALPRTVSSQPNDLLQIIDDTIAIGDAGTWADLTDYREVIDSVVDNPQNLIGGTFTLNSDSVTINFTSYNGDKFTGVLSSDHATLVIAGTSTAVYVKN
jgi:hypothetical protein